MSSDDEVLEILNDLVETCRDGEQGFRTASDAVSDPQIKRLFATYSEQRGQFANELSAELERLGGDPERRRSIAGSVHRRWMNLRSAVSGSVPSVLAEAERGEDAAKAAYERALRETTLPPSLVTIVERQLVRVREAHDRVRGLLDRAA
ncbi:MAG: ferritin-like domain-containing protein [Candidatus Rokuibacteriota bacterium]